MVITEPCPTCHSGVAWPVINPFCASEMDYGNDNTAHGRLHRSRDVRFI
jgi:hypothetical protein